MPEQAAFQTYCLFCKPGQEQTAIADLKKKGYSTLAPLVVRWKKGEGGVRKSTCRLLPGYVFFDAQCTPDWSYILGSLGVIRVLKYDDGEYALRGDDLEFIEWLKKYDGTIEISRVIQVGSRIEFIDGPLKEMEGKVIKVNKSRKQVQISLGSSDSLMRTVWCSIDYIKSDSDTDRIRENR